jgi:hypothetical protein
LPRRRILRYTVRMPDESPSTLRGVDQARTRGEYANLDTKLRLTRGQRVKVALFLGFARILRSLNLAS